MHDQHLLPHLKVTGSNQERTQHRKEVAFAQAKLQEFISLLQQLPCIDGVHTFSMDAYAFFECWCGVDLPQGFNTEFGRQLTKACRDGRLPFERGTAGRGSHAIYRGLDKLLLTALLGQKAS